MKKNIIMDILKNSLISIGIFYVVNAFSMLFSTMVILISEHSSNAVSTSIIILYTLAIIALYMILGKLFIKSESKVYNILSCMAVIVIQFLPSIIYKDYYIEFLYPFVPMFILIEKFVPQEFNKEIVFVAIQWLAITLGAIIKNDKE